MAENEGPKVEKATLAPLGHTTINKVLDQGPEAIKMIAAANGHRGLVDANVTQEDSVAASVQRGNQARQDVTQSMPRELRGIVKGETYWHAKRGIKVTVVECSIGKAHSGHRKHLAVDGNDNLLKVSEEHLELVR